MITIGLVRHGITKWNKERRTQGGIDIPLSEEGIEMARKLASRLANEQWDIIYTSPLQRAQQTAKIIASKQINLEIVVDERVREIGEGEIEGTTEIERLKKWGKHWTEVVLNIEEDESVVNRILAFIEEVKEKTFHQSILIVSHGSLIERMIEILCPSTSLPQEINNASLTIIEIDNQNKCILKNCVQHLQKL